MKYPMIALLSLSLLLLTACGRGPTGAAGADGAAGSAGGPGARGEAGRDGEDGEDGSDADSVRVVKLCPGDTVYPTSFVEVAFCIDGKLYGTYSTHGGFSTELPPGRYSSNAIGSRCDFTVAAGCVVSQ